jgi:hypothetical protein
MRSINVWAYSADFDTLYQNARRALARARRKPRALAHAVCHILDVGRNARAAEAIYLELSTLCDAELARRGSIAAQIPPRLRPPDCRGGPASLIAPRRCAAKTQPKPDLHTPP